MAVLESAEDGKPPREVHCHLLKAMKSDAAKRVVTKATKSEDCHTRLLLTSSKKLLSQLFRIKKASCNSQGLSQFQAALVEESKPAEVLLMSS